MILSVHYRFDFDEEQFLWGWFRWHVNPSRGQRITFIVRLCLHFLLICFLRSSFVQISFVYYYILNTSIWLKDEILTCIISLSLIGPGTVKGNFIFSRSSELKPHHLIHSRVIPKQSYFLIVLYFLWGHWQFILLLELSFWNHCIMLHA